jgi:uncharacterized repeat protein (TIGR03943 family)
LRDYAARCRKRAGHDPRRIRSDRHAPLSAPNLHDIEHGHLHAVAHGHAAERTLEAALELGLTWVVVLLPLALGLVVAPSALGTSALGGERVTRLLLTFAPGSPSAARPPQPAEALDDVGPLLAYLRRAGSGSVGQPVRVTGMVMTSDALGDGEFALLRYAIAHCVADARPVALLVVAPTLPAVRPDQWVEIDGEVAFVARGSARKLDNIRREPAAFAWASLKRAFRLFVVQGGGDRDASLMPLRVGQESA